MQTAEQWGAAKSRSESYSVALSKLLAVGITLVPLVMLLFPELNHCSGNTSHGRQDMPTGRSLSPTPSLIPDSLNRNDKRNAFGRMRTTY